MFKVVKLRKERVGLYFDGSNFYETIKMLELIVDYRLVLEVFGKNKSLIEAVYYTGVLLDENRRNDMIPLLDWLSTNGYRVMRKPAKRWGTRIKGNVDVEIAVDIMIRSKDLDHIYLFSGDGDFLYLVRAVQQMGRRVTIVSSVETPVPIASTALLNQADDFIDLKDIGDSIRRK